MDKVIAVGEAKEHLLKAIELLKNAVGDVPMYKTYVIDHLEIIASRDHDFLSRDINLDNIIESLGE